LHPAGIFQADADQYGEIAGKQQQELPTHARIYSKKALFYLQWPGDASPQKAFYLAFYHFFPHRPAPFDSAPCGSTFLYDGASGAKKPSSY